MEPFLTTSQKMVRESIRRFSENTVLPLARDIDAKDEFPSGLYQELANMGIFGSEVSETLGGSGFDTKTTCIIIEELARCSGSIGNIFAIPVESIRFILEHGNKRQQIRTQTPYNIGVQLNILAKNQDDGLQILEQILPWFQPDYTVTIKPIDGWTNYKQDVPIVLTSVSIADEYEGDFVSRRVLTYQLDFTMKMTFYSGTGTQNVIKSIDIDWYNKANTSEQYAGVDYKVSPTTATEDDTLVTGTPGSGEYNIVTSYDPLGVPESWTMVVTSPSGTFTIGEIVTGSTSGTTGEVSIWTPADPPAIPNTILAMAVPSGYLNIGETMTGGSSGATAIVASYTTSDD